MLDELHKDDPPEPESEESEDEAPDMLLDFNAFHIFTFISGVFLKKQKFQKTPRAPKEGSLSQNICKKSARISSRFKVF